VPAPNWPWKSSVFPCSACRIQFALVAPPLRILRVQWVLQQQSLFILLLNTPCWVRSHCLPHKKPTAAGQFFLSSFFCVCSCFPQKKVMTSLLRSWLGLRARASSPLPGGGPLLLVSVTQRPPSPLPPPLRGLKKSSSPSSTLGDAPPQKHQSLPSLESVTLPSSASAASLRRKVTCPG